MDHFPVAPSNSSNFAPPQNREHASSVWEGLRDRITQLYSIQNKPLGKVMSTIEMEHNFVATQRQYKIKISEWHLDKNIKDEEIRFIAQTQVKRALEDKDTNFRVRGRDVDPEKITRAVKRKKISEEDLLTMPSAPTPSDISYGTPSAVDQQSPYVPAGTPAPAAVFDAMANQVLVQSPRNPSDWQNQPSFLISPSYQPATPAPAPWYGPSTPHASASFQTPPGMLQSPQAWWNTGPMEDIIEEGDVEAVPDESKFERLIELVRKTEETKISDYMGTMLEVNSLVYDLVTSDESTSRVSIKDSSALIPACHICKTLEEIGTDDMDARVESERILLEAIAVSEGCFGEEHPAAFHFRVRLLILYEDWDCRTDSRCDLLVSIILLASRKVPTAMMSDHLSALLDVPDSEPVRCLWLQDSSRGPISSTSAQQLSTLSIRDDTIQDSARNAWGMISVIIDRSPLNYTSRSSLEPILELVLRQGPECADGSSYFWMAIFISVLQKMWGPIYHSKILIGYSAGENLRGSKAIKSSLENLVQSKNSYQLQERAAAIAEEKRDGTSLAPHQSKFDDISKLDGPLENLEELRLVLAEVSLGELQKSDNSQAWPLFLGMIDTIYLHSLLCSASQLGHSILITKLSGHFSNATFEDGITLIDHLDISGSIWEWAEESPLHLAIGAGYYLTVEALLDAGADPDCPEAWDDRAVNLAADAGHHDIVGLLIKRDATLFYPGVTILKCIIGSSDQKVHARFLEDLFKYWYNDTLPLIFSIVLVGNFERYGLLNIISEQIKKNLALMTSRAGELPLRSILADDDREYLFDVLKEDDDTGRGLELLFDVLTEVHIEQQARGILKNALFGTAEAFNEMVQPTETSESPVLHTLVSRNAPNALGIFLNFGPNLAVVDIQGNTALHVAAAQNRVACAKKLLKFKIVVDKENNDGQTARQIAVAKGYTEIAEEIDLTSVVAVIEGTVGMG